MLLGHLAREAAALGEHQAVTMGCTATQGEAATLAQAHWVIGIQRAATAVRGRTPVESVAMVATVMGRAGSEAAARAVTLEVAPKAVGAAKAAPTEDLKAGFAAAEMGAQAAEAGATHSSPDNPKGRQCIQRHSQCRPSCRHRRGAPSRLKQPCCHAALHAFAAAD